MLPFKQQSELTVSMRMTWKEFPNAVWLALKLDSWTWDDNNNSTTAFNIGIRTGFHFAPTMANFVCKADEIVSLGPLALTARDLAVKLSNTTWWYLDDFISCV